MIIKLKVLHLQTLKKHPTAFFFSFFIMTVHVYIISFNLEFHLIIYELVQIQTWTQHAAVVTTARCVRVAVRKKNKYLDQYQTIYINLHASNLTDYDIKTRLYPIPMTIPGGQDIYIIIYKILLRGRSSVIF